MVKMKDCVGDSAYPFVRAVFSGLEITARWQPRCEEGFFNGACESAGLNSGSTTFWGVIMERCYRGITFFDV